MDLQPIPCFSYATIFRLTYIGAQLTIVGSARVKRHLLFQCVSASILLYSTEFFVKKYTL